MLKAPIAADSCDQKNSDYDLAKELVEQNNPDYQLATALLEYAHEFGDARATYALATWRLFGSQDFDRDWSKAAKLLKLAAKGGVTEAHYDLAVCYEMGRGVKKNTRRAYLHYLIAAIDGDEDAIVSTGRCLYYGVGVDRDRDAAEIWFRKADALGVVVP